MVSPSARDTDTQVLRDLPGFGRRIRRFRPEPSTRLSLRAAATTAASAAPCASQGQPQAAGGGAATNSLRPGHTHCGHEGAVSVVRGTAG